MICGRITISPGRVGDSNNVKSYHLLVSVLKAADSLMDTGIYNLASIDVQLHTYSMHLRTH